MQGQQQGPQQGQQQQRPRPEYEGDGFNRAVDAAVQQRIDALLPDLMARLALAQAAVGSTAPSPGDGNFVQALALQLAELTGQGTGRVYVAPEVVERRRMAWEQLTDLLLELRAQKQIPTYRLLNKVFLNLGPRIGEVVIDPIYRDNNKIIQSQEIDWSGFPSLAMAPVGPIAERVFALFCEAIGHQGPAQGPDKLWALSADGAIIRGGPQIISKDEAKMTDPANYDPEAPSAGIRRHDQPPKQKIQVLGSLTAPVEVS